MIIVFPARLASSVRDRGESARGELPLELVEDAVAGQNLRDAGVGLAALAYCGEELAVLQLDAVHRHVYIRHVDLRLLAVDEIVVASDVGPVVADVAEESAERTVVV